MSTSRVIKIKKAEHAMTLIEVMIAIVILTMAMGLVMTGLSQTSKNKIFVEEVSDHDHRIRMAMERMVRELSMAYVSMHVNPTNAKAPRTLFKSDNTGGDSVLHFTSFSHQRLYRNSHESDQNELSYYVTDDLPQTQGDGATGKTLVRREDNRIDEEPDKGGEVTVLLENVESFELTFLDSTTMAWGDAWDSKDNTAQLNRLPLQVKLVVKVKRHGNTKSYATRASLPMTYALNHSVYR